MYGLLMHKSTLGEDRLRASVMITDALIASNSTRVPVEELARVAGISQRTFHRYFASRADVIEPWFHENSHTVARVVRHSTHLDVFDSLVAAHEAIFGGEAQPRVERLFPLVFADPASWAVFLRSLQYGEDTLRPVLAERLRRSEDDPRTRAAAVAFVGATRISLESMISATGDRPAVFRSVLRAFDTQLFDTAW